MSELFLGNKNNLLKAINNFELELDLIKKAIYEDDKEKTYGVFLKNLVEDVKNFNLKSGLALFLLVLFII